MAKESVINIAEIFKGTVTAIVLVVVLFALAFTNRHYSVWSMEMQGKAQLAEATENRKIQVEQAKAEMEAATHRAKAIEIVGEAAKKYPEYRQQE